MNTLIRKLKIYELIGSADANTIEVYNWINDMFTNLTISKQKSGNLLYSKNNVKLFIQIIKIDGIYFDYNKIWKFFDDKCGLNYDQTQEIIKYIMFKYFKINNHMCYELDSSEWNNSKILLGL